MSETTDVTFKPEASTTEPPATPAKAAPAAGPPRALPSDEDIAAWIHGADVPTLGAVFEGIDVKRFDALVMQVRKEELVPQHWQVLSSHAAPDDTVFDQLPEVGRLRARYKDQELSRKRLPHLRYAWRELGGRRPNIWTVADLLAAMRRIYDKKHPVDWTELLSAMRDIWRDSDLPFGRDQLEILWACLVLIRKNTKK
jgi:hypothetical protein